MIENQGEKMKDIKEIVPEDSSLAYYTILHRMFDWQRRFGDHCFEKNHITDNEGNVLTFNKIYEEYQQGKFGPNDLPNVWLKKFHECMAKELEEVEELLPWKHWSKESIAEKAYPDKSPEERLNMLKIELVDVWHFLMSAMMCVGMGPKELHDLYIAKNKVNFDRQQKGYNTAHKTEEDNLELAKAYSN